MRQFAEYKFLRQKPIDNYIVDFYCSELSLIIEIDGDSHAESLEYDAISVPSARVYCDLCGSYRRMEY